MTQPKTKNQAALRCLFSLIMLTAFTPTVKGQDTTYFNSNWQITDANNAIFYRIDIKSEKDYERTDYFVSTDQIQMHGKYLSLNPEVRTGEHKWYHENGKLKHVGTYSENKEVGTHKWYYDNGNIEAIENYLNGILDGEYIEHYSNGKPSIETSFVKGVQNGLTKYYGEDGKLHTEGHLKDGDRDGLWKYYDDQGNIMGTTEFQTDYVIEEANMFLKLPNSEWKLTEKIEGTTTQYYFKRNPVIDKNGLEIIPAIMVFVEDASKYEQDATLYSAWKRKPFMEQGVKIDEILIHENENYPLPYKNAYFNKCSYTSEGFDHVFYMIHILNKDDKGIQVYLDMTKDIAEDYESEFWTTIQSIKEL